MVNKVLCVGGPDDAKIKEVEESTLTPLNTEPIKIPVTLPDGIVMNYVIVFLAGNNLRFPIAVWEELSPDDIFKSLLTWYATKHKLSASREETESA